MSEISRIEITELPADRKNAFNGLRNKLVQAINSARHDDEKREALIANLNSLVSKLEAKEIELTNEGKLDEKVEDGIIDPLAVFLPK